MVKLIADIATKNNEIEIQPFRFGSRQVISDIIRRYNKGVLSTNNCFCNLNMAGSEKFFFLTEPNN